MKYQTPKTTLLVSVIFVLTLIVSISVSSCSKEEGGSGGGNPVQIEGNYIGTWVSEKRDLPKDLIGVYEKLVLTVDENYNYSWKYIKPDNSVIDFTGTLFDNVTEYEHSSTSRIWEVQIDVTHINGNAAPGGWKGIYTYEKENILKLNVEPNTSQWSTWPTAAGGIGSGQIGTNSIYVFTRQ
jgi:hypothetical protein